MTRLSIILTVSLAMTALAVFGQDNQVDRDKMLNTSRHWSGWKSDTTTTNIGTKIIIKTRQKYARTSHGWVTEEIIFEYDKCDNLVHKTKKRTEFKCFGGKEKIKYDKQYKSNCAT